VTGLALGVAATNGRGDPANVAPPRATSVDPDLAAALAAAPRAARPTIRFEDDFADVLSGDTPPPEQLVPGLIVADAVNWFGGHPKQGKTTIVLWAGLELMRAGRHVVWFDWENGKRRVARRLKDLGAEEELVRERFHYAYRPVIEADLNGLQRVEEALGRWPGAFVVFDSAGKALSTAGLNEDSNTETLRWTTTVVIPTRDAGATVGVVDHVPKGATRSTPYPRGAGTKLADTEVMWYVEAVDPFRRTHAGRLRLTNHADRDGVLPEEVQYRIGDGAGGLPIERADPERERDDTTERVIAALSEHAPDEEHAITANQLCKFAGGRKERVSDEAARLGRTPGAPVEHKRGPRGSVLYWHAPTEEPF
jgi:AAA domain